MSSAPNGSRKKSRSPAIRPNSIHRMDCVEGMRRMNPGSADLVVTDPPFGIKFKSQRGNYNRTGSRRKQRR